MITRCKFSSHSRRQLILILLGKPRQKICGWRDLNKKRIYTLLMLVMTNDIWQVLRNRLQDEVQRQAVKMMNMKTQTLHKQERLVTWVVAKLWAQACSWATITMHTTYFYQFPKKIEWSSYAFSKRHCIITTSQRYQAPFWDTGHCHQLISHDHARQTNLLAPFASLRIRRADEQEDSARTSCDDHLISAIQDIEAKWRFTTSIKTQCCRPLDTIPRLEKIKGRDVPHLYNSQFKWTKRLHVLQQLDDDSRQHTSKLSGSMRNCQSHELMVTKAIFLLPCCLWS